MDKSRPLLESMARMGLANHCSVKAFISNRLTKAKAFKTSDSQPPIVTIPRSLYIPDKPARGAAKYF